ncbi:large exoprotein [Microbacterium immunditiarum]|uniref:Large exoprotein n=1 Tax=Microbacterium immunditiarum TaxID=337480 RepID=A0A7Y9GR49_9MICO|nr:large exoprotein [Microbacterium immunditiarum]NYE20876.1 hypothetical protein [Microbacterium immunditiarum]
MDYNDNGWGMIAFWLAVAPILFLLAIAAYVVGSFFLMKVFDKAGVQGRWRAWVPVYNSMVAAKLGDLSPWVMLGAILVSALLGSIPAIGWIFSLVGIAAWILSGWRIGLKLNKDWPYLLLWLIPGVGTLIWLGILAFDKTPWNPNIAPAPWRNSFLKDTTVWQGVPVQPGAPVAGPAAGYAAPGAAGAYPPPGYQQPPAPPAGYQPPAPGAGTPVPPPAAPPAPPASAPTAQPPATEPPAAAPPAATEPPSTEPPSTEPPSGEPPRV